jgi:DnaD/phage-associated family protein
MREKENSPEFELLIKEVQRALGKLLSSDDVIKLYGIYDYLGLPFEVILQLVTHCKEECTRRNGPGRIPTMKYIEKAAFTWEREGIFSLEAAEAYLKKLSERRNIYGEFAVAMGIRNRQLSATEQKYVDSWANLGFKPEAAAIAYDRTVMQTGKLSWSYMDKIMKSWHQKNLHTTQEIEAGDGRKAPTGQIKVQRVQQNQSGNQNGTASAQELDRMRQALKRMRGE